MLDKHEWAGLSADNSKDRGKSSKAAHSNKSSAAAPIPEQAAKQMPRLPIIAREWQQREAPPEQQSHTGCAPRSAIQASPATQMAQARDVSRRHIARFHTPPASSARSHAREQATTGSRSQ